MNFKNNHILNQVRHTSKLYNTNFISQKNVYNLLWYFISQQCYAQRTNRYDGTCLDYSSPSYSKSVDVFFLLWLYRTVPLEECIVFDKIQDLDAKVDNLSAIDLNKNILYVHQSQTSIFYSLFEKMRNSLAHGTFNLSNRYFMYGQAKSKIISPFNFYLQIRNENGVFEKYISMGESSVWTQVDTEPKLLFKESLKLQPGVIEDGNEIFYGTKKIVLAEDFNFEKVAEKGSQLDQVKMYVTEKNINNALIVLQEATNAIFNDEDLNKRNVGVISYTHLPRFFECKIERI